MALPRVEPTLQRAVDQTYLALRLAMVLLVVLLFAAVAWEFATTGGTCLQPSLSAYYYTPVRPVLVASLCAVGTGLIVYRGNTDLENVLLDVSGFLSFVVAFVPTRREVDACDTSNVPSDADVAAAIHDNVPVLFVVGVVAVALGVGLLRLWHPGQSRPLSRPAALSAVASALALLAGVAFYLWSPTTFRAVGHWVSAVALFVAILLVVGANALDARHRRVGDARYHVWYVGVLGSMVGAVVVLGAVRLVRGRFDHLVLGLETSQLLGFLVFWVVQTVELGGYVSRYTVEEPPADRGP